MQQNMYYQPQPAAMMMMPTMGQMGPMMGFGGNQFYQQVKNNDKTSYYKKLSNPHLSALIKVIGSHHPNSRAMEWLKRQLRLLHPVETR